MSYAEQIANVLMDQIDCKLSDELIKLIVGDSMEGVKTLSDGSVIRFYVKKYDNKYENELCWAEEIVQ